MTGDGDYLRWRDLDAGTREWLLKEGIGDCPGGCSGRHANWFRIVTNGSATVLREWFADAYYGLGHADAEGLPTSAPVELTGGPNWRCDCRARAPAAVCEAEIGTDLTLCVKTVIFLLR